MSAFYTKNVPSFERALRLVISVALVIGGLVGLVEPWRPIVVAGGAAFALTGLFGFCPACAMIGRKLGTPT